MQPRSQLEVPVADGAHFLEDSNSGFRSHRAPRLSASCALVKILARKMSNLFRNVPFLTSLEVSPFCFSFLLLFFVVGLARSVALRSPKGGAVRAKRRARPTTPAPPSLLASCLVAALLGEPPLATGDCSGAPTSAAPAVVSVWWSVPRQALPSPRPVSRVPKFPATAAPALDIRSRCSRAALRIPKLCSAPTPCGGSAAPVGTTDSDTAPPRRC